MSRVRVPKYRKHKPSKLAVVSLCGRDIYLGKYGTKESHTEYNRLISEYLKSKGEQVPPEMFMAARRPSKNILVVEAADRYLIWSKSHQTASQRAHVHGMLKCLVGLYENERAAAIGPAELREIRKLMVSRGWSRNYVNEQIGRLKRMYKWLAIESLVPETVQRTLALLGGLRQGESNARETDPVLPVDAAAVDATLPHLPEVIADMVRLQRLTGMRPVEVCMLRPCDIDRTKDVWLFHPITHKTQYRGKKRVILIGPKAQSVLLRYLARDKESYCFQPRDSEAKRRVPRGRGTKNMVYSDKYHSGVYRRAIHRACDKAFPHPQLEAADRDEPVELTAAQREALQTWRHEHRWSPNQLRHAAATEIRRGFGLEAAQVILGHSRADVTQIYAERDLTKGVEVARLIG